MFAIIFLVSSASSLKCYKGESKALSVKGQECATGEDRCANVTTATGVVSTKCMKASDIDSTKQEDKKCKTVSDVKTCICETENCNLNDACAASPSTLKCYYGTKASDAKKDTACGSCYDRCITTTKSSVVSTGCFASTAINATLHKDEGCMTASETKTCLCKKANCNNPSSAATFETMTQVFTMIAVSSLMKVVVY